ncbi:MAG: tetratricopeptide repeat protein [Bacteroidota bacterium]
MLQPKKKISKREIKQDKLVTRAMQAEAWALENKKTLTYGGMALIAIVVVLFVWNDRRSAAEVESSTRLARILPVYDQGNYQQAIDGVASEGTFGLKSIVDEYGGTNAGQLAHLYFANALAALGKYAEASDIYEDISVDDRLVMASAAAGQARCYEGLERYKEAGGAYERAASTDPKNPLAPDRLFSAAVNFKHAGMKEEAREALATMRKLYPTSSYARDMARYEAEFAS